MVSNSFKKGGRQMKEFHIINVGNSILSNFKNKNEKIKNIDFCEEEKWKEFLKNPDFLEEVYAFLLENPSKNSAEINSFLKMVKNKNPGEIDVYLFGTKTASNEICRITIERYLKENGFNLYTPKQISGYFWEEKEFDPKYAKEQFTKDIGVILDRILYLARKKREKNVEVYINPTGGFKPHVIASALAGFLTGCKVYYIHEEFKEVILLPKLFYLPKGKEIELLKILSDRKPRSGYEFEKLNEKFEKEIERLYLYGLIEKEKDETGKEFRVKITDRGILYYEFVRKNE
jgi:putative CRISPR-associated protein (TIGR02619 family)